MSVADIQATTHGHQWHHVAGTKNPADLVSRGMTVDDFIRSKLWKPQEEWLNKPQEEWPISPPPPALENSIEARQIITAVVQQKSTVNSLFARFSSLTKLITITSYCLRFIRNTRLKARPQPSILTDPPPSQVISVPEGIATEELLVRLAQTDAFAPELKNLKRSKPVAKQSHLRALNPFIDQEGTLRVRGRLRLSDQQFQAKHSALLPSFHPFTRLMAKHYHLKLQHGCGQLTLSAIREKYWPFNGRRLIRSIVRSCYQCTRVDPVPMKQQTGQLLVSRITPSRAFTVTGVDYAGPVYLRAPHKRAAPPKAYIAIFVCFSAKAVHIELDTDLTTSAFLAALRRFTARCGLPAHIHSDNGKNFEGAKNELVNLYQLLQKENQGITSSLAIQGITWHMTPPKAPHFGGLWEAAVKVAKKHLHRQLGNSRLSYEDLSTVLLQIEVSINSRPLVPLSEDPNDLNALTPAHFLIGSTMQAIPDPDECCIPICRLDHYQQMQLLHQKFWHRWRTEYLQELQRDMKVNAPNIDIKTGRLVVFIDENQAPLKWPLARIVDIQPGKDELSRVVILRTSRGIIKRPIVKICPLPFEEAIDDEDRETLDETNYTELLPQPSPAVRSPDTPNVMKS